MQTFVASRGEPQATEQRSSQTWPAQPALEERGRHVLLAEDDADFRAFLAQAFRRWGYQVTECVDGPDLVAKLGSYVLFGPPVGFDLVVSDIRMPGATALEILEAMRDCEVVPPVILITAFPTEDTRNAARRLGVAAVFEKPFELEELLEMAENLLAEQEGRVR